MDKDFTLGICVSLVHQAVFCMDQIQQLFVMLSPKCVPVTPWGLNEVANPILGNFTASLSYSFIVLVSAHFGVDLSIFILLESVILGVVSTTY